MILITNHTWLNDDDFFGGIRRCCDVFFFLVDLHGLALVGVAGMLEINTLGWYQFEEPLADFFKRDV